jgi:hypothetical protein
MVIGNDNPIPFGEWWKRYRYNDDGAWPPPYVFKPGSGK